jgi:hypothetical protein
VFRTSENSGYARPVSGGYGAIAGLQTRAGAADEVQRQKSPTTPPRQAIHCDLVRRDTIALRTEPGTPLVQNSSPSATNGERHLTRPLDAVLEKNPKRGRGSDGEHKEPTTIAASQGDIGTSAENDYAPIFGIQVGTDTYALRTEPGTLDRRKKNKTGKTKHSRAPAGAWRQK